MLVMGNPIAPFFELASIGGSVSNHFGALIGEAIARDCAHLPWRLRRNSGSSRHLLGRELRLAHPVGQRPGQFLIQKIVPCRLFLH